MNDACYLLFTIRHFCAIIEPKFINRTKRQNLDSML